MITAIEIENFKGIRDRVKLDFRPITLLFGANSAGKSIIGDALNYLEACLEAKTPAPGRLEGRRTEFGNGELRFQRLVHNHDLNRTIRLKVSCDIEIVDDDGFFALASAPFEESSGKRTFPENVELFYGDEFHTVSVELGIAGSYKNWEGGVVNSADFVSLTVEYNDVFLAEISPEQVSGRRSSNIRWRVNLDHSLIPSDLEQGGELQFSTYQDLLIPQKIDPPLVTGFVFADRDTDQLPKSGVASYLNSLMVGAVLIVQDRLRKRRMISGIRSVPDSSFMPIPFPNRQRWSDGKAAWDFLGYCGEDALIDINAALGESGIGAGYHLRQQKLVDIELMNELVHSIQFGEGLDNRYLAARANALRRVGFVKSENVFDRSLPLLWPNEVGTGLSQVVPVIVACRSYPVCLNFIAQPELHLHPVLQCELADIFIDSINRREANSFVLETHSEHLILRLLRRIRETERKLVKPSLKLRTDELGVYHFRQEDGCTMITELEVDVEGDFIQPWPDNFFELDFYERFKTGDDV